jgi:hypothetical protein
VYNDLLRAAEGLPGFEQLKILPVTLEVEQCRKFPTAEPWSLAETLEFFGQELSHSNVQNLLGQNWSGLELLRKFSDELQRPSQFHVEVQLVLYLMSVDKLTWSVFNFIGCSRYSCLLCHMFVKGCGQFETRGCQGKILGPWSIPEASGLSQKHLRRLANVLSAIQKSMGDRFYKPGNKYIDMREDLSVKGSSIASTTDIIEDPRLERAGSINLRSQRSPRPEKFLGGRYELTSFTAAS